MSIAELHKTSLEELLASSDRGRYELVHGRLVEVPVGNLASSVGSRLTARLQIHCEASRQGESFNSEQYYRCFGEDDHARKPDASFVRRERLPPGWTEQGYFEVPPDLAVEVTSINDIARDVEEKVEEYLEAGIPLVWVIHPEARTAMIYRGDGSVQRLREQDELQGEDILPGFRVRLGDLIPVEEPTPPKAPVD
jgi:Uma2 family endonuclease